MDFLGAPLTEWNRKRKSGRFVNPGFFITKTIKITLEPDVHVGIHMVVSIGWLHMIIWVFPKIGLPQIINSIRVFPYKPSILGCPYFWKHPYVINNCCFTKHPFKNCCLEYQVVIQSSRFIQKKVSSSRFSLPMAGGSLLGGSSHLVQWLVTPNHKQFTPFGRGSHNPT